MGFEAQEKCEIKEASERSDSDYFTSIPYISLLFSKLEILISLLFPLCLMHGPTRILWKGIIRYKL